MKTDIQDSGILKLGVILMVICLAAGLSLALTDRLTSSKILEQVYQKQLRALQVVLPQAVRFSPLQKGDKVDFYRGYSSTGKVIGYAFPGKAKGYSSIIQVMVGIDLSGTVTGIKVTEEKETPGLGDNIVQRPSHRSFWQALAGKGGEEEGGRPPFQQQFVGKKPADLKVVTGPTDRDIQSVTGATITSRAVTKAVRESLEKFLRENKIDNLK